jgi:hypothetical protein
MRASGARIARAIEAILVVAVVVLGIASLAVLRDLAGTPGGQTPQLAAGSAQPSTIPDLMPMGNAHIPTTNVCILCHGAGGEVKTIPAILHPVEGWRRCITCHTNGALGRTAPGHDGIAETECLNCHKTAQTGPAITQPHTALHDQHCLDCHGSVAHLPTSMASSKESSCVLCHKAAVLPPPSYPHVANARLSCRMCHQSAEVGALPIDHALRADTSCLLCHEIAIRASASPSDGPAGSPSDGPIVPLSPAPG